MMSFVSRMVELAAAFSTTKGYGVRERDVTRERLMRGGGEVYEEGESDVWKSRGREEKKKNVMRKERDRDKER